jgi:hypothetical protein
MPRRYDPRVQPLPTEAGPRSVCAQCGEPLPAPNGSPTFVYGVGPVGYQSCAACGAKWRYLWQHSPLVRVKPERSRRTSLVVGGLVIGALVVAGVFALVRSTPWSDDSAGPSASSSAPNPTATLPDTPALRLARTAFAGIVDRMDASRAGFVTFLVDAAPAAPQLEVNETTAAYVASLRNDIQALEQARWPGAITGPVGSLTDANRTFVQDLDQLTLGQQRSASYLDMLRAEAEGIRDAEDAIRRQLRLPASRT